MVAEALAAVGRGMEPDPADGSEKLEDATVVFVISGVKDFELRSQTFPVASAAAVLVAAVARTNPIPGGPY